MNGLLRLFQSSLLLHRDFLTGSAAVAVVVVVAVVAAAVVADGHWW